VTARGLKHLRELMGMVAAGDRAVLLFIIQREDTTGFAPADDLDPAYGKGLREAAAAGVDILAYDCALSVDQISARKSVPVLL
ncbi:MAG: DNA/RNA nuclease SfsA, partial [Pseudomonadota bacterium]